MTEKHAGGRPTKYSEELTSEICSRMAAGESLKSICKSDDMPAMSSVFLWLGKYKEFSDKYAKATEARADCMFEEMLEIADDGTNDYMLTKDGEERYNSEHVNRSRLRVDTRKWMLARMRPLKYGDKQQVEHSGSINTMSDEELEAKIKALTNGSND